jgi:hypothetical protein
MRGAHCPRSGPVEGVWGNREVPPAGAQVAGVGTSASGPAARGSEAGPRGRPGGDERPQLRAIVGRWRAHRLPLRVVTPRALGAGIRRALGGGVRSHARSRVERAGRRRASQAPRRHHGRGARADRSNRGARDRGAQAQHPPAPPRVTDRGKQSRGFRLGLRRPARRSTTARRNALYGAAASSVSTSSPSSVSSRNLI